MEILSLVKNKLYFTLYFVAENILFEFNIQNNKKNKSLI
jgi:hypothetical protein